MSDKEVMWTPEDLRLSEWDGKLDGYTTRAGEEEVERFYNMYPFLKGPVPLELPKRKKPVVFEEKSPGQTALDELFEIYDFMKVK